MTGFFAQATTATTAMVTNYGPTFGSIGLNAFRGIAIIRLCWEGFKIAFRTESANKLAELLILVCIAYGSLVYYSNPIPGVGKSLTRVVTDAGSDLAQVIDTSTENNIGTALGQAMGNAGTSSWSIVTNSAAMVRFFILESILSVMQAAILGVIALGFIVTGILVLVGPIFLPFILVPHFEWMAMNWFRCLIQYSFYPVIGNAFVFVYGQIWLNYFSQFTFPMDSQTLAAAITVIVTMALAGVYGLFKVPVIVSHLFSGSSGLGSWQ